MTSKSDALIISYLKSESKHEKGYRLLMQEYGNALYNQVYRLTQSHQDTDDILQNTLIKIFRGIASFKEKSSLYSWMYRIAYNESMTFLKRKKRFNSFHSEMDHSIETIKQESLMPSSEIIMKVLTEALHTLPEKQRIVFELRYFNDKSYREMSDILGTSQGALKASYHFAVKKIEAYVHNIKIMDYEP